MKFESSRVERNSPGSTAGSAEGQEQYGLANVSEAVESEDSLDEFSIFGPLPSIVLDPATDKLGDGNEFTGFSLAFSEDTIRAFSGAEELLPGEFEYSRPSALLEIGTVAAARPLSSRL
jgi:hypothetical protein